MWSYRWDFALVARDGYDRTRLRSDETPRPITILEYGWDGRKPCSDLLNFTGKDGEEESEALSRIVEFQPTQALVVYHSILPRHLCTII